MRHRRAVGTSILTEGINRGRADAEVIFLQSRAHVINKSVAGEGGGGGIIIRETTQGCQKNFRVRTWQTNFSGRVVQARPEDFRRCDDATTAAPRSRKKSANSDAGRTLQYEKKGKGVRVCEQVRVEQGPQQPQRRSVPGSFGNARETKRTYFMEHHYLRNDLPEAQLFHGVSLPAPKRRRVISLCARRRRWKPADVPAPPGPW